jgi:acyl-CoA thioesterase-1
MLRGLDPEAMQRNLLSICEQLRKRDIPVILTGMLAAPNLGRDYVGKFNGAFTAVATQCGASLYPFFLQDVVTDPKLMLGDRIHPNSAGIARIAEKIEPMVASALTKEP